LLQKLLLIATAGALGTLARYGLGGLVHLLAGSAFPWGTVTVNLLGSFLFGVLWSVADSRLPIGPQIRAIGLVGFMGAFTTFSTFSFEAGQMLRDSEWLRVAAYLLLHNVLGIACLLLGLACGRWL
jgi:CrcB protein